MKKSELESRQDAIYSELMHTSALLPEFGQLLSELRIVQAKLYKLTEKIPAAQMRTQEFNIGFGTK